MTWTDRAREEIRAITADLPKDMPFKERAKRLRESYPFARRNGRAYKAWCREQRRYLAQFEPPANSKRFPLTPLEQMIARAKQ
ncbi:hypothetical protein ACQR1H_03030 [Bradyrhizobium sp. HKCCYLRH2015]|uniref:hypothetical protein n=1 Tax=Bradyrhizobium sp. HKCCYLRH2015 TaxID=3420742 RepID=UPI003EBAD6BA